MIRRLVMVGLLMVLIIGVGQMQSATDPTFSPVPAAQAQTAARPFIMPVALPAGPSTWLLGQPYGNTTGAFNFGDQWYRAGQGLHFGIDLAMPCRTPLVAVADGEVVFVDNLNFGAGPHNLLIRHAAYNVISLYGHLLEPAAVQVGQFVRQGDLVALSGDPDVTCDSRPHLHYEIRSLDYRTTYNPVTYIDANWAMLASIGSFSATLFQQDLNNARRWMSLDDQPDIALGGRRLNAYNSTRPLPNRESPPATTLPLINATPLPEDSRFVARQLTYNGCCPRPFWHSSDSSVLYVIDGAPEEPAVVMEWSTASNAPVALTQLAPPPLLSADGSLEIVRGNGQVQIRNRADGTAWFVSTGGVIPVISPDNRRLLWVVRYGQSVPGTPPPTTEFWVSDINGQNGRALRTHPGGTAYWLDGDRVLLSLPDFNNNRRQILMVYDLNTGTNFTLGTFEGMRGVSIAPGGGTVMFYLSFNPDPTVNGIYALATTEGATPEKMAWFGGWRWRDAESVFFLPFDSTTSRHTLMYYHLARRETLTLTGADFTVADGDWSVAPDGERIVFLNADDKSLWLLELEE